MVELKVLNFSCLRIPGGKRLDINRGNLSDLPWYTDANAKL
jgi:hypothetical protein